MFGIWLICWSMPRRAWQGMQQRLGLETSFHAVWLGVLATLPGAMIVGSITLYHLYLRSEYAMFPLLSYLRTTWPLPIFYMLVAVSLVLIFISAIAIPVSVKLIEARRLSYLSILFCWVTASLLLTILDALLTWSHWSASSFSNVFLRLYFSALYGTILWLTPFQLTLLYCTKTARGFKRRDNAESAKIQSM